MSGPEREWDVFIAHASEDKDALVEPLAIALGQLGLKVWYDVFALLPGDSLSRKIDEGLAGSRFGVVVVSPDFMQKPWPERELRGLVAREVAEGGQRVIIPLWFRVTHEDVLAFSPPLADAFAIRTDGMSAADVAIQVLRAVRPDLYAEHPRADLERMASGEALRTLQGELERFRCPQCRAPLISLTAVPIEDGDKNYGQADCAEFECGHITSDGWTERPCPSDPRFPKWEHFDLDFATGDPPMEERWWCNARPKTRYASALDLRPGFAPSREAAERAVREQYDRKAARWKP